jgi:hypothetical protein
MHPPQTPSMTSFRCASQTKSVLAILVRLDPTPLFDIEEIDHRTRKRGDCIAPPKFAKNR